MQHLVPRGLQGVDPEVDGRASGEGSPLLRRMDAEGALELRFEPGREVAAHGDRRIRGDPALQPLDLLGRERRRRKTAAIGKHRNVIRREAPA